MEKILVVCGHPDDETLMCGASIVRWLEEGKQVEIAFAVERIEEYCEKAFEILGLKQAYVGYFPDNQLDTCSRSAVNRWVEGVIEKVEPNTIITHYDGCLNIDHRYVNEAVRVATRPFVRHINYLMGEVPSSSGFLKTFEPNYYVEVTYEQLSKKIKAMEAYVLELRKYPHPRHEAMLLALAQVRGSESGFKYAEAFRVGRIYV